MADPRSEVDIDALYYEIAADEDGRFDTRRKVSWKGHYGLMITGYRDAAWLPETGRPDEWRGGGAGHHPQGRREGYGGALGSDLGRTLMSEQGGGAVLVKPGLLHLYTLTPAGAQRGAGAVLLQFRYEGYIEE